jgi:hypothetical protein
MAMMVMATSRQSKKLLLLSAEAYGMMGRALASGAQFDSQYQYSALATKVIFFHSAQRTTELVTVGLCVVRSKL